MPDPRDDVVGIAANEPRTPTFHVNSQPQVWRAGLTLIDVVRESGASEGNVATALNGRFVSRTERHSTFVQPGDAVLLFAAIVGG
jgi:thiamine biosynthesis protein ThiS